MIGYRKLRVSMQCQHAVSERILLRVVIGAYSCRGWVVSKVPAEFSVGLSEKVGRDF